MRARLVSLAAWIAVATLATASSAAESPESREAAADAGLDTSRIRRLGIPDYFVEHGERSELLADLGLDAEGIASTCRELATRTVEA